MAGRADNPIPVIPREPASIPVLETSVPGRPQETMTMTVLDASEYEAWARRAMAAGHVVECQHHIDSTIFVVVSKRVP